MNTSTSINNFFNEKLRTLNQEKILIKRLKLNFYLEFQICHHLETFKLDLRQFKINTCQNVIISLNSIKEKISEDKFNLLLKICKKPLLTYIKDKDNDKYELKNSLGKYFSEKDNERKNQKKVLEEILDEA